MGLLRTTRPGTCPLQDRGARSRSVHWNQQQNHCRLPSCAVRLAASTTEQAVPQSHRLTKGASTESARVPAFEMLSIVTGVMPCAAYLCIKGHCLKRPTDAAGWPCQARIVLYTKLHHSSSTARCTSGSRKRCVHQPGSTSRWQSVWRKRISFGTQEAEARLAFLNYRCVLAAHHVGQRAAWRQRRG